MRLHDKDIDLRMDSLKATKDMLVKKMKMKKISEDFLVDCEKSFENIILSVGILKEKIAQVELNKSTSEKQNAHQEIESIFAKSLTNQSKLKKSVNKILQMA